MSSQMYYTCRQYLNRAVRVTTLDGRCYEGIIVDVDSEYLYLQMTSPVAASAPSLHSGGRVRISSPYPYLHCLRLLLFNEFAYGSGV